MTDLIPIGRFAQITHLSVKALRIYAQEDLLQPMYVDPDSGYRYYALAQAALAARIRLLRLVDMPLEEIRAVLQASDPEAVQAHLSTHQQRMRDRIARDQQALLLLQRVRDQPDAFLSFEARVKEVPDRPLLSLSTHAGYGTFGQAIRSAFGTLVAFATATGIYTPDQPPVVIIHQYTPREYQEKGTHFEVCLPVPRLVEGGQGIVSSLLADGPVLVIGEGLSLILDQQQDTIGWSITLRTKQPELKSLSSSALHECMKVLTRNWSAPIREIITTTPRDSITSLGGFYDRDPLQHARAGTLVLLGDAAHPMSPFRGEGANMAMLDTLSFVEILRAAREDQLVQALVRYEQEMLTRTRKAVLQSRQAAQEMHSRNPVTRWLLQGKLHLANRFLPQFQKQ